ncbi:MAG: transposase [Fibrella sp.]|nr:transposase [Armatimonadota bacterium]
MTERARRLLDLYTDYLLVSFGQATAMGLAALLPQVVSHDQVTRFLSSSEFDSKDLWKVVKPHVRQMQSEDGCLIFDDTIQEKPYTDSNELICTHFDHVENRFIKGVNLLTALYYSRDVSLPIDFELIQKTKWVADPKTGKESFQSEETKNAMMRRMIDDSVRKQVPFRYVLVDIWFACVENMVFIKQKKRKDFVFPFKANRRIALSEVDKQNKRFTSVSELPLPTACAPNRLRSQPLAKMVRRFRRVIGSIWTRFLFPCS